MKGHRKKGTPLGMRGDGERGFQKWWESRRGDGGSAFHWRWGCVGAWTHSSVIQLLSPSESHISPWQNGSNHFVRLLCGWELKGENMQWLVPSVIFFFLMSRKWGWVEENSRVRGGMAGGESPKLAETCKSWLPLCDPPQPLGALGLLPVQKCIFSPRHGKEQSMGSQFTVEFSPSTENGPTFTHTVKREQLWAGSRGVLWGRWVAVCLQMYSVCSEILWFVEIIQLHLQGVWRVQPKPS